MIEEPPHSKVSVGLAEPPHSKISVGITEPLNSKVSVGLAEPPHSKTSVGLAEPHYPQISVVIPARNESRNLLHVLPHIPSTVSEVVLIDGRSTDDTIAIAQQLLPTIKIIKQTGRGKGDALRLGFAACTGDIIVMLDADGSANPREIPLFVEALLQGHDFAKGSRFIQGGGSHDLTWLRRLGNYGLSTLVNVLFGTKFSDLCYGYNAFWRYCLDYVEINCDGFEIETFLNIRAHKACFKIIEVASFEQPRIYGVSNLDTFRDGWRVLKTIVKERRTHVQRSAKRRYLFSRIGAEKRAVK
jgi:glycosyltransferase involved in cell wall biosynthesis